MGEVGTHAGGRAIGVQTDVVDPQRPGLAIQGGVVHEPKVAVQGRLVEAAEREIPELSVVDLGHCARPRRLVTSINPHLVVGNRPTFPLHQTPEVINRALAIDSKHWRVGVARREDRVSCLDVDDR